MLPEQFARHLNAVVQILQPGNPGDYSPNWVTLAAFDSVSDANDYVEHCKARWIATNDDDDDENPWPDYRVIDLDDKSQAWD